MVPSTHEWFRVRLRPYVLSQHGATKTASVLSSLSASLSKRIVRQWLLKGLNLNAHGNAAPPGIAGATNATLRIAQDGMSAAEEHTARAPQFMLGP